MSTSARSDPGASSAADGTVNRARLDHVELRRMTAAGDLALSFWLRIPRVVMLVRPGASSSLLACGRLRGPHLFARKLGPVSYCKIPYTGLGDLRTFLAGFLSAYSFSSILKTLDSLAACKPRPAKASARLGQHRQTDPSAIPSTRCRRQILRGRNLPCMSMKSPREWTSRRTLVHRRRLLVQFGFMSALHWKPLYLTQHRGS
jgi:hypothetical protein